MQQPSIWSHRRLTVSSSAFKQNLLARFNGLPRCCLFGVFTAWQTHLRVIHPPAEELARQLLRAELSVQRRRIDQAVGVDGKGDDIIYRYSIAAL